MDGSSQVVVKFGRSVTDDDLEQLRAIKDVTEAKIDQVDIDIHVGGTVFGWHPVGDPAK
jgi:hypothetical protein